MSPDTAALRTLADRADDDSSAPVVTLDTATVRALCDAADEVERIDFTIGVERIAQAIDAAWQEAHAADRNDGGYLDGYLDGLEHAEGIVRTTLANPTTTEADA